MLPLPKNSCLSLWVYRSLILLSLFASGLAQAASMPLAASASFASQPLYFEANQGQLINPTSTQFFARTHEALFALSATDATITLSKSDRPGHSRNQLDANSRIRNLETKTIHLQFVGANRQARMIGDDLLPARVNYFVGNDSAQWQTSVPLFTKVQVRDLYPGIEMVYYGNQEKLEYDFVVAPGMDPRVISFQVIGPDSVQVDPHGDLLFKLGQDEFRQQKLVIYQIIDGVRKDVSGGFRLRNRDTVSFEIGGYDRRYPLIIDPVLSYSALLGGSGTDAAFDLALDGSGNIYVVGETISPNLPVTPNAFQTTYKGGLPGAQGDAFVAKFDNSGSNLVYLTYLGGSGDDVALRVAVDSDGAAYITGVTDSTNFPPKLPIFDHIGGVATNFHGQVTNFMLFPWDAFVTKLDPSGSALVFSTYLGGDTQDEGLGIALDANRNVYIAGYTDSTNFPIVNAAPGFDRAAGRSDVYVTRISSNGTSIDYSIRFGGTNDDQAGGIAVSADGTAFVTGWTASTNFPVSPDAFQPSIAGFRDAFFTVLNPAGGLVSSTFFGGVSDDFGFRIALDSAGTAYITGSEEGAGFPITPGNLNPGGVFVSGDAAATWSPRSSGLTYTLINSLALDPNDPTKLYVGNWRGVYASADAGENWEPVLKRVTQVPAIVVDPSNSSRIYAGIVSNVYTILFATNWTVTSTGVVNQLVNKLAIDPVAPATLYAATEGGVYKSTNAASTWIASNTDLTEKSIRDLALDPTDHTHIYAATADGVFFSTNAGARWIRFKTGLSGAALFTHSLSIDPANHSTLYVATEGGVFKSFNFGTNWLAVNSGLANSNVFALAIDPAMPSTLYAGTTNGLFKTVNGGTNWTAFNNGLTVSNITALAINPNNPATLYAGTHGKDTFGTADAFLARFGPNPFFTFFGGNSVDEGWDVAVDPAGNAYVTGNTFSTNFIVTTNNLSWPLSATNSGKRDAFITAISADNSHFLYSAYLGGTNDDFGLAIQADSAGNAYVVGETASRNFPTRNTSRTSFGGSNDVFLAKISMNTNPTLLTSYSGNQIVLRWPAFAPEYTLQFTTNLSPSAVWLPVTSSPTVINGFYTVTLDQTNNEAFFRLKK